MRKAAILSLIISGLFIAGCAPEKSGPAVSPANDTADDLIVTADNLDFSKHKVTFIEIGADRCIPCKAMQPIMKEIAEEFQGTIQVVFYDVWKYPEYGQEYGVQIIPTQIFMDSRGREVFRHTGLFPKEDILSMLKDKNLL